MIHPRWAVIGTVICLAICLVICLAAGLGLRAASSPAVAAPVDEPWQVSAAPFTVAFTGPHGPVTTEVGGGDAGPGQRLSYQVGGPDLGTEPSYHQLTTLISSTRIPSGRAYTVATDEPGRTARVVLTRTNQGVRLRWTLSPATDVTAMFETLSASDTEHYLSGSSAAYVDLRGRIRGWSPGKEGREAREYCQNQEQTASPFYLSSGGYGFYAETDHVGRFAFPGAAPTTDGPTCSNTPQPASGTKDPQPCPVSSTAYADRVQICVKSDELTYDVFTGSPAAVTTDYYRTVGMPSLPPPSQFALMKWRDVNADQQQVLDDVAEFKRLRIPLGTIWIDNPWEQQPAGDTDRKNGSACTSSFRFDTTFFPHPQAMIDRIHAEGVKFGLWVSPSVSSPSGYSCAGINDVWSKNGWLIPGTNYIDFTIPAARAYYIHQLTKLFSMGVDMTKEDRGEEYRLESAQLAGGSGASWYLRYPSLYQSAVSTALRAVDGNDFETLVRAGAPGTAQNTHGMWGSDTYQTFDGLRGQVRYGISESLTGHFAWGSDIGGIDPQPPANASDSPSATLFTRWAQFGAVSPVFAVGGAGMNATPWLYDSDTVRRFRDAVVLHYELYPYLYGLAEHAARTGVPIMRALGYEFPNDAQAWAQDQEFMVGPDLLAAPVTSDRAEADGDAGAPTPVDVYLPAGRWVDLYSGKVITGGRTITRETTLDESPLYLRAGTAIGFNARTARIWRDGGWGTDDLAKAGLSGWMYAPGAGTTRAVSSAKGTLSATVDHGQARLTLTGSTRRVQVLLLSQHAPTRVSVNGHVLGQADDLTGATQGWTYRPGPFGGVMIKLAPDHGSAHVDVDLD